MQTLSGIAMSLERAREYAFEQAPTEYGIFDAQRRAEVFACYLAWNNLIVSVGKMDAQEVDRIIKVYSLEECEGEIWSFW